MAGASKAGGRAWTLSGALPPLIAVGLFALFWQALPIVASGGTLRLTRPWIPSLGVELSFFIDGLSLIFALLITGIGALVMLYSARYLAGHVHQARFSVFLTSFMLSMLGLVLADNLLSLFVFWELTTITSYLLIGFGHESATSRRSALQALLVTATGGLAMLAGFILIGGVAGSFELSEIRAGGDILREHALYLPILILILCGAFTKSAQVPFHFWLPNAMAAPTPVSAYLHSATMVKGGVYLLARLHPSLSGTDVWLWTLTIFGAATAVFASVLALRQTDIKQALAYTTLMALGTLVLFLAAPSGYAITAMATFLVVHSLYKAALFLMIGCVDYRTGTRDVTLLGGLARRMPLTALAAALAALAMAGVPPFLGFIAKELLYKSGLESPASVWLVTGAIFAASALMFAVAAIVAFRPFFTGRHRCPERHVPQREAPWEMLAGPLILSALGLAFGLMPALAQTGAVAPIVAALTGSPANVKELYLWGGFNLALYLSLATFAAGLLIYAVHPRLRDGLSAMAARLPSFDAGWDSTLGGLRAIAGWQTGLLQSGVLARYKAIVFTTLLVGLAAAFLRGGVDLASVSLPDLRFKHYTVFALCLAGITLAVSTRSRIASIAGVGVVGISVALIFILYGAPDVAITQLLVETLVVVLFAVAALRLPLLPQREEAGRRLGDAGLSLAIGGMVTVLLLAVTSQPLDRRLTTYFEVTSWPEAFGRNIVNVILVDFRALDTFGEVAVVLVAAIAAFALLRQGRAVPPAPTDTMPPPPEEATR